MAQGHAETFDSRRRAAVAWLPRGEILPGAAILLIGGDKTGDKRFYERMIPVADRL